jgi:hypothetical protein
MNNQQAAIALQKAIMRRLNRNLQQRVIAQAVTLWRWYCALGKSSANLTLLLIPLMRLTLGLCQDAYDLAVDQARRIDAIGKGV